MQFIMKVTKNNFHRTRLQQPSPSIGEDVIVFYQMWQTNYKQHHKLGLLYLFREDTNQG